MKATRTCACFLCHSVQVELVDRGRGVWSGGLCSDCKAIDQGADFEDRLERFAARQRISREIKAEGRLA